MLSAVAVLGIDALLGRLDYTSLSPQALMESLIGGFDEVGSICGSREEPKDLAEWEGVTVEEDLMVKVIDWSEMSLSVSFDVQWAPPSIITMDIGGNLLGADPMEGHPFVVGQDQYPSMGRFRKPPLVAMGSRISLVARRENVHSFSVD
ncbi:transposase IS204/IS1001/IS1096/IS1165 family protein [Perkinsela sp. CCAP 1560/4]|nr:transposase IS204/IS1001/IS1096/IS1165 family protein [Perkinsela sp. CCAP 1560/4]|eukprot:KNH04355.1 transposase IS204/IS1001/IS1096/IS1165 family protein [Perkinsela sp. CCAP 1560/4]